MDKDYAKKYNIVGGKWGYEELCAYFNRACAEAIRDTKLRERRRAANILKESGHECRTCVQKILGKKGGK